jgi:hypothetical protein
MHPLKILCRAARGNLIAVPVDVWGRFVEIVWLAVLAVMERWATGNCCKGGKRW